jgi:cohesin complex subunit SA-1/2
VDRVCYKKVVFLRSLQPYSQSNLIQFNSIDFPSFHRKRSRSKEPKKDAHEDDEIGKEEESVMSTEDAKDDDDNDDESQEDGEDFLPARKRKSPRKSPVPKSKATATTVKRKAVSRTKKSVAASTNPSQLRGLLQKFKAEKETAENSLALALLTSDQSGSSSRRNKKMTKRDELKSTYTTNLQKIAQSVIAIHNQESPNKAHILLCNLIFRSVGGSFDHLLNDQDFDLEEMAEEEWNQPLERFIHDMEEAPVTLLELGNPSSNAIAQYRIIFEDFFYQLGKMATAEGSMPRRKPSEASKQGDNSESESDEESNAFENNNATFQIQVARDIVSRLVEMYAFSVPNIRAAVCIAVYRMGAALLEKTLELLAQLQTAERQNKVAKRSRSSRKSEALETQIASWKRMLAEIEGIVQDTVMGIFIKRYRDSNASVRAEALRAITGLALIRPDRFLNSMYLKYIGWMLSDKDATVREAALRGLLEPFLQAEKRKNQAELGIPIDLSGMDSVISKFLSRLADCSLDVDPNVQEVAMELLLVLVRQDYFDNVDNDSIWEQINLRAISPNATPRVRRDALYFVMEQLSSFDSGAAKTESMMVDQINQLVDW